MEWNDTCPRGAVWTQPPRGWSWVNCPGRLVGEEDLRQTLSSTDWGLVRRDDKGLFLAFPWSPQAPFPIPQLFCLCRAASLEGRRYLLFRFSRRGCPELPQPFLVPGEDRGTG